MERTLLCSCVRGWSGTTYPRTIPDLSIKKPTQHKNTSPTSLPVPPSAGAQGAQAGRQRSPSHGGQHWPLPPGQGTSRSAVRCPWASYSRWVTVHRDKRVAGGVTVREAFLPPTQTPLKPLQQCCSALNRTWGSPPAVSSIIIPASRYQALSAQSRGPPQPGGSEGGDGSHGVRPRATGRSTLASTTTA
jgi:hypothetical protein